MTYGHIACARLASVACVCVYLYIHYSNIPTRLFWLLLYFIMARTQKYERLPVSQITSTTENSRSMKMYRNSFHCWHILLLLLFRKAVELLPVDLVYQSIRRRNIISLFPIQHTVNVVSDYPHDSIHSYNNHNICLVCDGYSRENKLALVFCLFASLVLVRSKIPHTWQLKSNPLIKIHYE